MRNSPGWGHQYPKQGQEHGEYKTQTWIKNTGKTTPDLTAIPTYFKRWQIRTTSFVQIHTIFAKSCIFYELPIRMNLYEWATLNPAPEHIRHWGLDKSYEWGRTNSYELATS